MLIGKTNADWINKCRLQTQDADWKKMPNGKQNADWEQNADTDADNINKMLKYP